MSKDLESHLAVWLEEGAPMGKSQPIVQEGHFLVALSLGTMNEAQGRKASSTGQPPLVSTLALFREFVAKGVR